jgi:hypothetical protein
MLHHPRAGVVNWLGCAALGASGFTAVPRSLPPLLDHHLTEPQLRGLGEGERSEDARPRA